MRVKREYRKLKEKRRAERMSRQDLAKRSGVSATDIMMFETGQKHPSLPALIKLAKALNCKAGEIAEHKTTKEDKCWI